MYFDIRSTDYARRISNRKTPGMTRGEPNRSKIYRPPPSRDFMRGGSEGKMIVNDGHRNNPYDTKYISRETTKDTFVGNRYSQKTPEEILLEANVGHQSSGVPLFTEKRVLPRAGKNKGTLYREYQRW